MALRISMSMALVSAALYSCAGDAAPSQPAAPAASAPASASASAPAPAPKQVPSRINEELAVHEVARDAYVITHEPFHESNVLVVRMGDGSLVISSSPFDTEAARAMMAWLRATFRPPRIIAINTHFHLDGTAGNQAYAEAKVETYASEETQALLLERGASLRDVSAASFTDAGKRGRVERTRIVPASRTFPAREGLRLTIAGEPVRVSHPGPAHSPDNVVVHFPRRTLLFGGCMIKTGDSIGYLGDADLDRWEAAVRALEPMNARVVVPGHGATGGAELLQNTIALVRAARAAR
jgi:glyoxylase-like metal-dependent hydrolase (beta-lactamase superfamily II)